MTWLHFPQNLSLLNVLISLTVSSIWKFNTIRSLPRKQAHRQTQWAPPAPHPRQPHSEEGTPAQPQASAGEVWPWESDGAKDPCWGTVTWEELWLCTAQKMSCRKCRSRKCECSIGLPYPGQSCFEKVGSCWKLTLWCTTASSGHVQPTVSRPRLKHCWF